MAEKGKMPPQLLAHFKAKGGEKGEPSSKAVTKRKKLVKNALKHPEQFASADLQYMELWLAEKARQKEAKKKAALQ